MTSPRDEAIEAMEHFWSERQGCSCHEAYRNRGLREPGCRYHETIDDLSDLLDAISPELHARIAIEDGGMVYVHKDWWVHYYRLVTSEDENRG